MTAPPAHGRQKLFVHLDQVIEQRSLRLHDKAGQQRVSRGRSKPLQRLCIVFARDLMEVENQMRVKSSEIDLLQAGRAEQPVAFDPGENRFPRRFRRIFPELRERRLVIIRADLKKLIESLTFGLAQAGGDPVEDLLAAGCGNGSDQALQRRSSGRNHAPESQDIFGFLPEPFREHALRQLRSKMFLQIRSRCRIEASIPEVIPEPLFILNFGCFPIGPAQRQNGRESQLPSDVVENADWDAGEVVQKPAIAAQHAELNGKTAAVVLAAAAQHLRAIRFRQCPVAGQLLFAKVLQQGHRRRFPCAVTRRHSDGCAPLPEPCPPAKAADRQPSYRAIRVPAERRVPPVCRDSFPDN